MLPLQISNKNVMYNLFYVHCIKSFQKLQTLLCKIFIIIFHMFTFLYIFCKKKLKLRYLYLFILIKHIVT